MEFVLRMFPASSIDQSVAIHRTDLLPFKGIYDIAGKTGGHELQRRPVLFGGLEPGKHSTLHATGIPVSE